jgi:hypothetical protein
VAAVEQADELVGGDGLPECARRAGAVGHVHRSKTRATLRG